MILLFETQHLISQQYSQHNGLLLNKNYNTVPFKNLEMERFLAGAPKKTKMYTNQRVQDAAVKERERAERLAKDEEARLAELYKMEQNEFIKSSTLPSSK
jgi:hypothetical protein